MHTVARSSDPILPGLVAPAHRWKVLATGFIANASFAAAFAGIPMTAILMRADYGLDNRGLGMVLGLLGLGAAVSELPWGWLTDRWGDRRVLLCGLSATALSLLLMAWLAAPHAGPPSHPYWLWSGMLAVGLFGGSVNGASGRAVMAWFGPGERGLAMSIRQTAVPAGGAVGALTLPAMAAGPGFAWVYASLALLCGGSALLTWRWLVEPPSAMSADNEQRAASTSAPLRDWSVWRVALAIGILCLPQFAVLTFASIFLHDVGAVGLVIISISMALVQVGAAVTRIWSGRWTDRHGNRRYYLRLCSMLSVLMFSLLALLTAIATLLLPGLAFMTPMLVMLVVAGGIIVSAWHGVAYAELATMAGPRHVGTVLGLGNTCVFAIFFLTAQMIPLLARHSWSLVWLVAAAAALLAWRLFIRPSAISD